MFEVAVLECCSFCFALRGKFHGSDRHYPPEMLRYTMELLKELN